MTILDIVSRDAFQESTLESGPGGPGGRWEPALNQSTKTNKRGWSLGGVARGAAIGGLVVGGAAVLASNAQNRKEEDARLDFSLQQVKESLRVLLEQRRASESATQQTVDAFVQDALNEVRAAQTGFERIRDQITSAVDASVNTIDTKLDEIQKRVGELAETHATMKNEVMNAVLAATDASEESAAHKLQVAIEEIRGLHAEVLAMRQGASLTSRSNPNVRRVSATANSTVLETRRGSAGGGSKFGGRRYV